MKKMWKSVVALLIACLLMIPVVTASAAYGPDLNSSCSLTVNLPDYLEVEPDNFAVDLYCVADLQPGDGYQNQVSIVAKDGAFGALADDLIPDEYGQYNWNAVAQKALLIALENEPVASGCSVNTPIESLEAGVYLVVVRGAYDDQVNLREQTDDETGETFYSTAVNVLNYEYGFSPLLVTLPASEGDADNTTANGGSWIYDVSISLKAKKSECTQKKLILHKKSDSGVLLPGAEFKLYATRVADASLSDDTITTYVEGEGYVTLYCIGTYTTDKDGNIVLEAPLLDDDTLYAWVETRAPEGYELDPEPHFFFAYGMLVPNDYASFINQPGVLETHLRYDNEHPNATGNVTFERSTYGDLNTVTLSNAEDGQPVYVRVRAYSNEEGSLDGETLESFYPLYSGEGWFLGEDGYYYYANIIEPGTEADPLLVKVEGSYNNEDMLPYAGRLAIIYDFVPVKYDQNGKPYGDWGWDPQNSEAEELSLSSGESEISTIASARGGYVIDTGSDVDVKSTGTARFVESCYYSWEYSDSDDLNGLTVINKFNDTTPPDNPGVLLPETGGIGTALFTVIGGGLIATAVLLLLIKKRKHA